MAPHDDARWQAMIANRQHVIAALPGYAEFAPGATTWSAFAARAVDDLLCEDDCWFVEPDTGIMGFRPYVKGTDQWGGASRTRQITELMAMMDVLWPLTRYLQLHPDSARAALVDAFIRELPKYYDAVARQSINRPGNSMHDSWYFMENSVLKAGHLLLMTGHEALREPYLGSLTSALEMAHHFDYLFPQFVGLDKQRATGRRNTINYSTAGLLAWTLIHAFDLTGERDYLSEAAKALTTMREVDDPRDLIYEPQELAAACAAAASLVALGDQIESPVDFAALAQDFFYAQAQMLYHAGGQIDLAGFAVQPSDWLPATWRDGLFVPYYNPVESGGINAPAFKENLESVIFWADYLRYMHGQPGVDLTGPLKILNLNRIQNFRFFSPCIPDDWERSYGPVSLAYIPYEDIDYYDVRPHEDESTRTKAGYNGKEIYGAGEALWAYLLFEALGTVDDRAALLVNLNVFDRMYPPDPAKRVYMVYNPYPDERTLSITFHHLDTAMTILADGVRLGDIQPGASISLTLPGGGMTYLTMR